MRDQFSEESAARLDPAGVRKAYEEWPALAELGSGTRVEFLRSGFRRVYVLGMGGSAAGGDITAGWLSGRPGIEVGVFKGTVPVADMSGALAIACSASGQTQETIRMLRMSIDRGADAVSISSGGSLMEVSRELGVPHIMAPAALAPRYLLPFMAFSCVAVAGQALGIQTEEESEEAVSEMRVEAKSIGIDVATASNPAKSLAAGLLHKTPAIYGSNVTKGVGVRFKSILNENAKKHSYFDMIPEVFHNEVEAWEDAGTEFAPVFLRHTFEDQREKSLTDKMVGMLSEMGLAPVQVRGRGAASLAQLMTMVYMLDMTAYYIALGLERDPLPTRLLDGLKK